MLRFRLLLTALLAVAGRAAAQPVVDGVFPPEEFAARRAAVFQRIGDAVAVLAGTTDRPGEQPLRQGNQFYYLSGVVEPQALLLLDGRTRRTTLFLRPRDDRRIARMLGPMLYPGDSAARATGIDSVLDRAAFADAIARVASDGRTIYTPFRPEVLGSASTYDVVHLARVTHDDPWDGRPSREEAFRAKLQAAAPRSELRDLDPMLDTLRGTKSPREIAVIREATRITGLAIVEAMRDARPGMTEYELQADAEFVFKKHGAYGAAYFALVATGPNTFYSHYHRNTARLADGDLVQFDYAPDYDYYVSDVTRVFPASGRFTPRQREFYGAYLALYRALLSSIRPHVTAADVAAAAVPKMDSILARFPFTDARIRDAARRFVDGFRRPIPSLGHTIGMEVHDVAYPTRTLEPGQIFTIEPAMQIPEEHLGLRLEDMLLVTERGVENLSADVPVEIADIERVMAEPGLSDRAAPARPRPRAPRR
ncbi:peptidase M24 [Gemmatirosa kalamazoonensis]|uniref:Xaa-Pro aminopeptidase n=1 Tax=Gemmatirosa kalamazoonensis TaxID=861299 RepID=W0RMQ6_9BACT|nr:Xaa-Pro peptidase family protein [Gemmatirosa kalamazoonensis]AHG92066.1 peptidase M24 [Gemmatirosa kalamazoonensis]